MKCHTAEEHPGRTTLDVISDDTLTDTDTDTQEELHLIYRRQRQMSVEKTKLYLLLEILRNWLNRANSILSRSRSFPN